jgi:DNA repair exonuclease SbcCD ATPase subunit
VLEERKLLNEINKITSDLAADRSALASAAANLTKLKADEAKIIDDLTQSTKRSRELMSEIRERSQAVESAGKGLYFGHRALLRDAGSVDWSAIDSEIHDFCEDFVSRWDTTSQNMESVCSAFEAAVLAGENTRASLAYKELDALLEETQKASKRAHQLGSDFHNRIVRETALREGDAHSYGVSSKASSIRSLLSAGRG